MPKKEVFPLPVRLVILALLGGGLVGAVVNLWVIPSLWPWEMPLLAHRFLAGAGAAYFAGGVIVWRKHRRSAAWLYLLTVPIYGFPLAGAILVEPGLVDWSAWIAWLFIGLITPAEIISLWYVWAWRGKTQAAGPLAGSMKAFLLVLGIAAGVVGLLVFVAPRQAGLLWPWAALPAWKPLDSRLVASMLLTIAAMSFVTRRRADRDVWQVTAGMLVAYCVVAGVGLGLHAAATPAFVVPDVIYIVIFAVIALMSLSMFNQKGA